MRLEPRSSARSPARVRSLALALVAVWVPCVAAEAQFHDARPPPARVRQVSPVLVWYGDTGFIGCGMVAYPPFERFGAHVRIDTEARKVVFEYRQVHREDWWDTKIVATRAVEFATEYWPNALVAVDAHTFLVAGKASNGDTLIERWSFAERDPNGVEYPQLARTTDGDAVWTLPPRALNDEVFRAHDAARDTVIAMIPDPAHTQKLYVLFDAWRELHSVDLETGTSLLAASPLPANSALVQPALTLGYSAAWSVDDEERGCALVFEAPPDRAGDVCAPQASLVFVDADRDGVLDTTRTLSDAEWRTEGWAYTRFAAR